MKEVYSEIQALGSYSHGIISGGFLFLSGQLPLDPSTGELVKGDAAVQADRVLKNIGFVLTNARTDFSRIVKTTVFLTDLKDFEQVNRIYADYFSAPYPARSCVEVSRLPKGALLEIEVIARTKIHADLLVY